MTNETPRTPRRASGRTRVLSLTLALASTILLVSAAAWRGIEAADRQAPALPKTVHETAAPAQASGPSTAPEPIDSYADVVDRVSPAVVTIRSERKPNRELTQFGDDPLFRRFFGEDWRRQQPRPEPERGLGSGVIVGGDGFVVTNHHVVEEATAIRVELPDGRAFDAELVGADVPSDLALLKIQASGLPAAPLGDSDRLRVGDVVLAIGNPLGIGQTVTMGIVSAKGRSTAVGDGSYEDFTQTDAPINRGNSGGPLVNTRGEVVGINSQILTPSGGSIGIGFAIPANMTRNIVEQLRTSGEVRRGRLGVTVQAVTADIAASLGLGEVRGALVNSIDADGAAARAGIERGDVITAFQGEPVKDSNDLRNQVASLKPGSKATLSLLRDGRTRDVSVTLGEMRAPSTEAATGDERPAGGLPFGLSVEPVTPEIARRLGLDRGTRGVVVNEVDPSGRAAEAGLLPGDVIQEVNRRSVTSAAELQTLLEAATGRPALLLVNRRGQTFFVPIAGG